MNNELTILYRARCTLLEMLTDRGFNVEDQIQTFDTFLENSKNYATISEYRKELDFIASKNSDSVLVGFPCTSKINTESVNAFREQLKDNDLSHAIFVVQGETGAYANSAIKNLKIQKIIIEIFTEQDLQINVTKHSRVPKHMICSDEYKKKVLTSYQVQGIDMPKILISDPQVKYLGASKGNLIKIIRKNLTMPKVGDKELKSIYYRIVS